MASAKLALFPSRRPAKMARSLILITWSDISFLQGWHSYTTQYNIIQYHNLTEILFEIKVYNTKPSLLHYKNRSQQSMHQNSPWHVSFKNTSEENCTNPLCDTSSQSTGKQSYYQCGNHEARAMPLTDNDQTQCLVPQVNSLRDLQPSCMYAKQTIYTNSA